MGFGCQARPHNRLQNIDKYHWILIFHFGDPMDNEVLIAVSCKFCNGVGKLTVTSDMIRAAHISNMKEFLEICPYCYGDGFLIDIEYRDMLNLQYNS